MNTRKYKKSTELPQKSVEINDDFWNKKNNLNAETAIIYQWDQLEKQHNQDNFRILAKKKEGYRFGFFYCDSDLHKWADAAARILTNNKNPQVKELLHEYIDLMAAVQEEDGYLYTYNQFHFPKRRWTNIQIEHELYSLGHLIEAAVSYMSANDSTRYRTKLLGIAIKAADLLVANFCNLKAIQTPGHQEIEIALVKLYRYTNESKYLELAKKFIYKRGKDPFFGLKLIGEAINQSKHEKLIEKDMKLKKITRPSTMSFFGEGETKHQKEAPLLKLRAFFQYLSGRYHQQNKPVHKMNQPVGHSVRWGYLATAMAMIYQETGDIRLLNALQKTWDKLVQKHLFITGGVGSLGIVEGFGRNYELNSSYCYCETCAAIASMMLNWEMALITNEAKYSDLIERQLYNAINVGIALDGKSYLYRNLLESDGQLERQSWFATPCCPSNISRTWANLSQYIYSYTEDSIWIHQYIGSTAKIANEYTDPTIELRMNSKLPWKGEINLEVKSQTPQKKTIYFRVPSWATTFELEINGIKKKLIINEDKKKPTGSGYNPNRSYFYPITRKWDKQNLIKLRFDLSITIHKAHPRVKSNRGKVALSRGPIVYCFESIDNPNQAIPHATIDLTQPFIMKSNYRQFDDVPLIMATDKLGNTLKAIPYYCWANREKSKMQVWIQK